MSLGRQSGYTGDVGDEQPILIQVPRFARGMKVLSAVLAAIWALEVVLETTATHAINNDVLGPLVVLALIPLRVVRSFELWRVATYALLHDPTSVMSLLGTVFTLWWFGSPMERAWGIRRVAVLLVAGAVAGGLLAVAAGFLDLRIMTDRTLGMAGPSYALLVAWGLLNARERFSFFGVLQLDGRKFIALMVVLAVVFLAVQRTGANVTALGGAAAGWVVATVYARQRKAPPARGSGGVRLRAIDGGREKKRWIN